MGILWQDKKIRIVDRSLVFLEIQNHHMNLPLLKTYCTQLIELGIDAIEIGSSLFEVLEKELAEIPFIIKIKSVRELPSLREIRNNLVIPWELYSQLDMRLELGKMNSKFIVNARLEDLPQINKKLKYIGKDDYKKIDEIRILDFDEASFKDFEEYFLRNEKDFPEIKMGIAPENRNKTGVGWTLELLNKGISINSITGSFAGGETLFSDLPIEEILVALKVLYLKETFQGKFENLPLVRNVYEEFIGKEIHGQKPILGREIFFYESGIHADGIMKNSATYEPFHPEMLGQKRRMILGKHSSIKSVKEKVRELSMDIKPECLKEIQDTIRSRSLQTSKIVDEATLKEIISLYDVTSVGFSL